MNTGTVSILNVAAGDILLSFDNKNPAETIRAARVVREMLRRGFALLVEIERDGKKAFERALDFDEKTCCYLIADFDPTAEQRSQTILRESLRPRSVEDELPEEKSDESSSATESGTEAPDAPEPQAAKGKRGRPRKAVPAASVKAVAVARSAGG